MTDQERQPENFLKLGEVCRRVGLGRSMIYRMIKEGRFPRPYKLSAASRWSERELATWMSDIKGETEGGWRDL